MIPGPRTNLISREATLFGRTLGGSNVSGRLWTGLLLPEVGMDRSLIEQYEAGAGVLAVATRGLSGEELDAHPVPGTWSIREIVVHLMDSDLVGSERMKRVIAMEEPSLLGYDETAFARALDYASTDVDLAAEVFAINRKMTARILRGLPEEAFDRVGHHSERGSETL